TAADLLGYVHFGTGAANVGTDVEPSLATALGAQGFTPPLGTGSYSFWIQNTTPVSTAFQFDFIVTALPEPVSLALIGFAGPILCLGRSRRWLAKQSN